jgi:hypothetical protein
VRHASEYWLLANFMVERLSKSKEEDVETVVDPAGEAQSPVSISATNSVGPLLDQYDQTSMQQVNVLISDFQKVGMQ